MVFTVRAQFGPLKLNHIAKHLTRVEVVEITVNLCFLQLTLVFVHPNPTLLMQISVRVASGKNYGQIAWSPPYLIHMSRARFLSLARRKLRLYSDNHRAGYFGSLAFNWLSIVWAYSEQETENGLRLMG